MKAAEDAAAAAANAAAAALSGRAKALGSCGMVRHTVTRYRISAEAFRFSPGPGSKAKAPWRWVGLDELKRLPLASAEKRLAALIEGAKP